MRRYGNRHHRTRHSDAVVERARQYADAGHSAAAVARRLGIAYDTVYDWLAYRTRQRG